MYIKPRPSLKTLLEENEKKMHQEEVIKVDVKTSVSNLGGKPAVALPVSTLQNSSSNSSNGITGVMVGDIKQYLFQQLQLPSELLIKSFFLGLYLLNKTISMKVVYCVTDLFNIILRSR